MTMNLKDTNRQAALTAIEHDTKTIAALLANLRVRRIQAEADGDTAIAAVVVEAVQDVQHECLVALGEDDDTPDELSDIQLADRQRELDADRDYDDETLGDA